MTDPLDLVIELCALIEIGLFVPFLPVVQFHCNELQLNKVLSQKSVVSKLSLTVSVQIEF